MDNGINTSFFDIFKIGPGPSSSHTIGPMKAANHFIAGALQLPAAELSKADKIEVTLYGSLASTGKGHGTDKAVLAGLLGQKPETCDTDLLLGLLADSRKNYKIALGRHKIIFRRENIIFDGKEHGFPYQNTLIIKLKAGRKVMLGKIYYSIGGGFIRCEGEALPETGIPVFRYKNMSGLIRLVRKYNIPLVELLMKNESAVSGLSADEINAKLDHLIAVMEDSVKRGIHAEGVLPGPIGLQRKAAAFYKRASHMHQDVDRFLALLNAFSMAVSEENAAGHKIITAPTSGSAGVIPGIIYFLKNYHEVSRKLLREGLMVAAAVAFIARHNASISGAEVGCQGEIGVAASMAAAMISHVNGKSLDVIEAAAEIALEHHLGMTCDPVGGFVQIPCIERNAVGAVTAYNAYLLASVGDPGKQKVNFDEVIEAMLETGKGMSRDYKETSKGGLAVCSLCG
ncbi:MAG: L-serine ammonia-lyase [Victivallaceae bacterium]|jgi:L-serine dehydratase